MCGWKMLDKKAAGPPNYRSLEQAGPQGTLTQPCLFNRVLEKLSCLVLLQCHIPTLPGGLSDSACLWASKSFYL